MGVKTEEKEKRQRSTGTIRGRKLTYIHAEGLIDRWIFFVLFHREFFFLLPDVDF